MIRTAVQWGLLAAAPALLIGGWLLVRNWLLYEDITATSVFIRVAGGDRNYTLAQVLGESSGLWRSLFAVFGWMNVAPPQSLYLLWNGLVLAAVAGGVAAAWQWLKRRERSFALQTTSWLQALVQPPLLLAVWLLVVYGGLMQFLLKTPAAQGRLLFPALVPLALGLAYGLSRWRKRWVMAAGPILLLAASVYCLLFVIPAAYARPPLIAKAAVPAEASRLELDMGQGVELVAALVETETAAQREWVWLTLYWAILPPDGSAVPEETPVYVLELFGRDAELLGKVQSYHGGGLFPADLWPRNEILVDRVAVRVDKAPKEPVQGVLNVKLEGETTSVDVAAVKILPASWPEPAGRPLAEVAGVSLTALEMSRTAVAPGQAVHLALQWHVLQPPGRRLTTFVHLGEQSQPPLAQGDSPPLDGHYPTHLWAAGEVVNDGYSLVIPEELPDGRYPLYLGFYDPETGERPVLTVDGEQQPNNAYFVGWIDVGR